MTKRDRRALTSYVRRVADQMGLRDWTFVVRTDGTVTVSETQRAVAEVDCLAGRKKATIDFCEDFRDLHPADQQNAVVHELVHCHLAAVQHQVEIDLEDMLSRPADALFCRSFRRNLEFAVDGLTSALVPSMPVILWPES